MTQKRKCPPIPQSLKDAVMLYLVMKTDAEIKRQEVDTVYREILQEISIFEDAHIRACSGERILDVKDIYLSKDEQACNRIYAEANKRLLERGIKSPNMKPEFCPALVAESAVVEAKWELVREGCKLIGKPEEFSESVFAAGHDASEKFAELIVKIVLAA